MGSSKSTQNQSSTNQPWSVQAPYIQSAFQNAQTAYGKASQAQAPTDFTAQMTPEQLATFRQMIGYGGDTGMAQGVSSTGFGAMNTGAAGATGALTALGAFDPSKWNNMEGTIGGAKAYAAGLDIPGAVRNAMLSGVQTARDVTNPMIDNAAASTGNTNSSRTGLAQGLVDRGLAEQASGLAASMYDNAYGTGANIAANQGHDNSAETLAAITGSGALSNELLGGGAGMVGTGIGDVGQLFGLAGAGGAGLQQGQQDYLTNLLQRYQSQVNSPFDALNNYYQIVGANNWGSQSQGTSTTTTTPSPFQTAAGIGLGLASLYKMSDRNAKEDITPVGKLYDGQTVYRYRYKGHPAWHIGLMAQEVEKYNPGAVVEFDGYKHVNYLEATKHIR